MTDADPAFSYVNLSGRPPGRVLTVGARLSRGVRTVQAQIEPFAEQWRLANLAALQQQGPLWVPLGDSMSQGIGASAYDRGWVGQLAGRLRDQGHGYRVVNLSFSGARVLDVVHRQLDALESLTVRPQLVTVMIGSNDLVSRHYRRQAPAAFEQLLARLPAGTVITNLPNPRAEVRAINALIEQAAAQDRLYLADVRPYGLSSWRGKLAADYFHPNERGYAMLASIIEAAVQRRVAALGPAGR